MWDILKEKNEIENTLKKTKGANKSSGLNIIKLEMSINGGNSISLSD